MQKVPFRTVALNYYDHLVRQGMTQENYVEGKILTCAVARISKRVSIIVLDAADGLAAAPVSRMTTPSAGATRRLAPPFGRGSARSVHEVDRQTGQRRRPGRPCGALAICL